jgi:2-C-methyl-D-erythritol 2,4-cyclodiphosphate synthase
MVKKKKSPEIRARSSASGQITGLGQDSHRFEDGNSPKPLVLGGVTIPGCPGLSGNSDADVVLHAITNAISGLHGVPVLGPISDDLCLNKGIRDSSAYFTKALGMLKKNRLTHVSVSIEAQRPRLAAHLPALRKSIARLCSLPEEHVALTVTSGEGLTSFGRGEGIQALAVVSAQRIK